jgi:hypothetical protein
MGLKTWLGLKPRNKSQRTEWKKIESNLIEPSFPIDVVYTWVDGRDPKFQHDVKQYLPSDVFAGEATGNSRFRDQEELRYSLRSIATYAPWVNRVYIVTNGQRPSWLARHPKVSLVEHSEILDRKFLPTFNSHVIGSALHRIAGLSEHYIYFNDDVLLSRPMRPIDFFTDVGLAYSDRSDFVLPVERRFIPDLHALAAANARDLILREWGHRFDHRLGHSYHAQLRSVAEECERRFASEYDSFRRNRFRTASDLLCCSFLHPYAAYIVGKALFTQTSHLYVKVRSRSARRSYRHLLARKGTPYAPASICLNDSGNSDDPDYTTRMTNFMDAYFPVPSPFESAPRDLASDVLGIRALCEQKESV